MSPYGVSFILWALIIFQLKVYQCVSVKLFNVTCVLYDQDFARFDLCEFKWTKQKMPSVSITMHMLQLPVTEADIRLQFHAVNAKKTDVLFDYSWDACEFLNSRKRNRFLKPFYEKISKFSNVNHSCPYGHDIHIRNYEPGTQVLPFPMFNGEYILKTIISVCGKVRLSLEWSVRTL